MARTIDTITLTVRLPWWWRPYFWALFVFEYTIGGVDPEIAADFVGRHLRIYHGRRRIR